MDELIKAVKSLISDIESMQDDVFGDEWFGPFSEGAQSHDGDYRIEWPNLAISLADVKKLLEPKTIEGELAPNKRLESRCPECNEPQFNTPSGVTCPNGHGGL